ncbi:hypothetical protein [Holophaga foetida]|uniref:hypothetical protein n=1 Tax=Holophaga foetida TaxID=35839 RepID=UPI0002472AC1|nr:hypothetical protein [Holophaga foetida]
MSLVAPEMMLNQIMGKVYNVLTNGDDTVPKSEDNFFSWCTPGIPIQPEDARFMQQGLTGVVRRNALDQMRTRDAAGNVIQPELTPAQLEAIKGSDAARMLLQAEEFARLVDFVPDLAAATNSQFSVLSVMNNEGSLSDRYNYILRMSQVMASELPAETKQKIEKFRGLLQTVKTKKNLIDDSEVQVTEPSPLVQAYHTKMADYMSAALDYNNARIDALAAADQRAVQAWAINASVLRNKVKAAMNDWVTTGYKDDYEQIAAYIDQVMQRDMSLLKQEYRDDLEKARLTGAASGSDFYYTSAVPGNFMERAGWTEFGFSSSDFNNSSYSSYSQSFSRASGGGGFLGIFGGGASTRSASGDQYNKVSFDSELFTMRFKIAQIPIVRPWFKTAFLMSKCWRMDQNNPEAKGQFASDGGTPTQGLLPAYPTSMILVRDLNIYFGKSQGFSEAHSAWRSSSSSEMGVFSLGPIHLGGSAGRSSACGVSSFEGHYDSETQTMKVPGTQIIGFKCHVFPKSPDPLSSITSWV